MNEKGSEAIERIATKVRQHFEGEGTGHDWWHVYRVWQLSKKIADETGASLYVVELGALMHDVADHKLTDPEVGERRLIRLLEDEGVDPETVSKVLEISRNVSFKGAYVDEPQLSVEGQVVQDADRLDAIGAIGIARAFAFGGSKLRPLYDPDIPPALHRSFEDYKKSTAPTINHFYEKLLLLQDRMNTPAGRKIAQQRHRYMEDFLEQFFREWEGAG